MTRAGKKSLTEKEKSFVDHFARTNDAVYSAHKAGYSSGSPNIGYDLQRKPMVRDAIASRRLAADILADAAPAVAQEFADRLLGRNGHVAPSHGEFAKLATPYGKWLVDSGTLQTLLDQDPAELTMAQIEARQALLEHELAQARIVKAQLAKQIDGEIVEVAPASVPKEELIDGVFA